MRFRLGNPFNTKMTKNNILNKEYKKEALSISVYNDNEIRISFESDGVEVDLRLSKEEIIRMADRFRKEVA